MRKGRCKGSNSSVANHRPLHCERLACPPQLVPQSLNERAVELQYHKGKAQQTNATAQRHRTQQVTRNDGGAGVARACAQKSRQG